MKKFNLFIIYFFIKLRFRYLHNRKSKGKTYPIDEYNYFKKIIINYEICHLFLKIKTYKRIAIKASKISPDPTLGNDRFSSSNAYDYLISIEDNKAISIISGSVINQSDYDYLVEAIRNRDKQTFINIAGKLDDLKLHNACMDNSEEDRRIKHLIQEEWLNTFLNQQKEKMAISGEIIDDSLNAIKLMLQLLHHSSDKKTQHEIESFIKKPYFADEFNDMEGFTKELDIDECKKLFLEGCDKTKLMKVINDDIEKMEAKDIEQETIQSGTSISSNNDLFRSRLIGSDEKKNEILAKLKKHIDEKGEVVGMDLAQLVFAASEAGWLVKPDKDIKDFHAEMERCFGKRLGGYEALNNRLKEIRDLDQFLHIENNINIDNKKYKKAKGNRETINGIRAQLTSIEEIQ